MVGVKSARQAARKSSSRALTASVTSSRTLIGSSVALPARTKPWSIAASIAVKAGLSCPSSPRSDATVVVASPTRLGHRHLLHYRAFSKFEIARADAAYPKPRPMPGEVAVQRIEVGDEFFPRSRPRATAGT